MLDPYRIITIAMLIGAIAAGFLPDDTVSNCVFPVGSLILCGVLLLDMLRKKHYVVSILLLLPTAIFLRRVFLELRLLG